MKTVIALICIFVCVSLIAAEDFTGTYSSSRKTSLYIKNELGGNLVWVPDADVANGDFFIRTTKSGSDDHDDAVVTFDDATDSSSEGTISLTVVENDSDDDSGSFSIQANKFLTIFSGFGLLFVFFAQSQGSSTTFRKIFKLGCCLAFFSVFVFVYASTNVTVEIEVHVPLTGSVWNKIEFDLDEGNFILATINAQDYDISTKKGDIAGTHVAAVDSESFNIHTDKGEIVISNLDIIDGDDDHEMVLKTEEGNIAVTVNYVTFNGKLEIKIKDGSSGFSSTTDEFAGKVLSTEKEDNSIHVTFENPDDEGPQDVLIQSDEGDVIVVFDDPTA